ncbi:hypothetical protein PBY51_008262 [Eleginops maclovinus]|uniref:Uncharacterized protein n=1 Tax=Eleginops maclovinus TaxID=56733 RepID=A0AAN7X311_ELEMC|nr:hypothetical protein PBY51_008262 [Eleginops maclovinus]
MEVTFQTLTHQQFPHDIHGCIYNQTVAPTTGRTGKDDLAPISGQETSRARRHDYPEDSIFSGSVSGGDRSGTFN